ETRAGMEAFYFNQRHESETLLVPQDYETIQAAIDASQDGDTVLVSPGVYVENINFEGKGITVASLILTTGDAAYIDSTIIDGNEEDCVVSFASEEDSSAVLQGFTIRNGIQDFGGGIDCQMNSGPTLMDLVITENEANSMGGGIYCAHNSNPDIIRVEIVDNVAQIGGGICLNGSHSEMREVMITQNTRGGLVAFGSRNHFTLEYSTIYNNSGVGIAIPSIGHDRGILLRNITVYGNDAGISIDTHEGQRDEINLINSIVCDNNEYELRIFASDEPTTLNVSFSDIDGGEDGVEIEENGELEWGDGNIDEDPQFVDSDNGDYHLTEDSPCIDTGDPDSPEDPDETRADMGAFYFHQFGRFIDVPDDFETIQAAVDAADAGDTVLVHPGTYVENVFVWYEDITIGSLYMTTGEEHFIEETIVDGDSIYAVFDLGWCESPPRDQGPVVLSGLTIRNGRKGIYCRGAYLRIENCIIRDNHGGETGGGIFLTHETDLTVINSRITNNTAVNGAGIYCHDPAPVITGCTFNGNFAEEAGGAIYLTAGAEPQIEDCIITGNFADIGGGIYCEASNPVITSCLFTGNMCENFLGWTFAATENSTPVLINCTISWAAIFGWTPAVFCSASDMIIANSLIWGDSPLSISFDSESAASSMTIAFSDIYGGPNSIDTNDNGEVNWLDGSIAEDPRYVDYWGGDYNLTENSPCVDAGTAFFVWEDDTLVNMTEDEYQSGAPDMGAYESEYSGINANIKRIPTEFTLHQNYPNPF
ncbi:MAG: right-handed parallel beta-helix repeat-containing protein, partial [Calditrichaeota bacterium]|nr:right-handed parallel beta-helix repeat-containing protein [Calditrichota bacterium]